MIEDVMFDGPEPDDGPVIEAEIVEETVSTVAEEVRSEALARWTGTRADTEGRQITNDEEWAQVTNRLRDNATFIKEAKARFKPALDKAQAALDEIRAIRDESIRPAEDEQKLLKLLWDDYERRRTALLAAQRDEEIREATRKAKEQAAREAEALRAVGQEEAAKLVEAAGETPSVIVRHEPEAKPTGASSRTSVGIEITDRAALLKAIVDRVPGTSLDWIRFDETAIRALARGLGAAFSIPGVVRTEKSIVSVRSR